MLPASVRVGVVVVVVLYLPAVSDAGDGKRRLTALVPNLGPMTIQWIDLQWPGENASTTQQVSAKLADMSDPVVSSTLKEWAHLTMPLSPSDSCRPDPNRRDLYCLVKAENTTLQDSGCCGDSFLIYNRETGAQRQTYLMNIAEKALLNDGLIQPDSEYTYGASHTFYLFNKAGDSKLYARLIVAFDFSGLNMMRTEAVIEVAIGSDYAVSGPIQTVGGFSTFFPYRDIGTTSADSSAAIFGIQYNPDAVINKLWEEEWHTNGLDGFETLSGAHVLALSLRYLLSIVLVSDPWVYDEVSVLQRFGTPPLLNTTGDVVGYMYLGVSSHDIGGPLTGGFHNVYYYRYATGQETITCYNNGVKTDSPSKVFEFDLNLVNQTNFDPEEVDGSVFDTSYRKARMELLSPAGGGGAIPLGSGVYFATTGAGVPWAGGAVVDVAGTVNALPYVVEESEVMAFYDPFTFVDVIEEPSVSAGPEGPMASSRRLLSELKP